MVVTVDIMKTLSVATNRKGQKVAIAMLIYLQMIDDQADKSKFEQLYTLYRQSMFYVANKILCNEFDAEDAVHQAFLSIIKNIRRISEPDCVRTKTYVITIAEHCAIDIYRAKTRKVTVPLDEDVLGLQFEPPHTSDLADAIAKLPARYRHIILLKYDCGYSNREIAKILGLSYEGVHSLDQRAKSKLKTILEDEGITI